MGNGKFFFPFFYFVNNFVFFHNIYIMDNKFKKNELYMNTTPKNLYYFVKNKVIFNISTNNLDNDPCGKLYKVFDTETKTLEKGDKYYDKNGNLKEAESDGEYEVSLGTCVDDTTITANKAIFPNFTVTYQYLSGDNKGESESVVYWLDDLISDGDIMSEGGKFEKKTIHKGETEEQIKYVDFFQKSYINRMVDDVMNGMTLEQVRNNNPFLFVNAETNINGCKAKVTASTIVATEEQKQNAIMEKIKEYGDKLLEIFDKECTVTIS